MSTNVEQAAQLARVRETWAAGNYDAVAATIAAVGERIVRHTAVREGDAVLDVACGTGNATIPAARTGARTVGLDLTPELFGPLRVHALAAGVAVDLVEGDAQSLPFEDGSFDVVLSTFGCMFAADHRATAHELARVLRPGGRLGVCAWTPDGEVGQFFRTVVSHMPPPPAGMDPPPLWGVEDHVRELFGGTGVELEFRHEQAEMRFPSVEDAIEFYSTKFGPVIMAKQALEPEGRWEALRDDMAALYRQSLHDGEVVFQPEYLVILGRRAG